MHHPGANVPRDGERVSVFEELHLTVESGSAFPSPACVYGLELESFARFGCILRPLDGPSSLDAAPRP